jgi:hypothetical protein
MKLFENNNSFLIQANKVRKRSLKQQFKVKNEEDGTVKMICKDDW